MLIGEPSLFIHTVARDFVEKIGSMTRRWVLTDEENPTGGFAFWQTLLNDAPNRFLNGKIHIWYAFAIGLYRLHMADLPETLGNSKLLVDVNDI